MPIMLRCGLLLWLSLTVGCQSNTDRLSETAEHFPVPILRLSPGYVPNATEDAVIRNAYAYLQALYRGDAKHAWAYSYVPEIPKQSWWNKQTALGALLLKAESSADFAGQKQGVQAINISAAGVDIQHQQANVTAHIIYGNGHHDIYALKMRHRNGQWQVAQD